jgi:methyl-accepting chemotaxis protein
MTESTLPFRHRLVGKMTLFGIVPTLVLVLVMVFVGVRRDLERAERDAERSIIDATRAALSSLEYQSGHAADLAAMLAEAQLHGGMFGNRESTAALLRHLVEGHDDISSLKIVYELGADSQSATSGRFAADVARDALGRVAVREGPVQDPFYDAMRRAVAQERRSRPFSGLAADPAGRAVVQQGAPLVVEGKFVGAVIVEHPLGTIQSELLELSRRFAVESYVSDGERVIAAHQTAIAPSASEREPSPVAFGTGQAIGEDVERAFRTFLDRPGGVQTLVALDAQGVPHRFGIARLHHGGWTLVLRTPLGEASQSLASVLTANLVPAAIGVTLIATVLFLFARGVGRRLERAVTAARRIAEGNLAEPVPEADAEDESGVLLATFERMTDNLNRIVGHVRHASIQINSTATELAATSRELETTATGFGASATEVAAATRQISTTGEELLHTMQAVADSAAGAAEKAQDSRNGLRSMQTSVRRLDEAAHSVAARLGAINEKAKGINAIVATITKVADETNLLSVNAAIEAEKAGDFGLGFLIVAREIRRLADQTASATLDIERMIRHMQSAVVAGVTEMDRFGESLRTVLDDVDRVGNRVQGIIAHVEDDTIRFVQVTEGMRSQAAGAKQIDEAMRDLSIGARQTMESAAGFGNAAGDLERAIAALKITVSSMRLRDSIERTPALAAGER